MLSNASPARSRLILSTSGAISFTSDDPTVELKTLAARYISEKIGNLPADFTSREQYESAEGNISLETLSLEAGALWAVRFSEPDHETAGRSWHVEITVGSTSTEVLISCRLSSFSRNYDFILDAGIPRIVSDIIKKYRISEYGVVVDTSSIFINSDKDAEFICKLIKNDKRWRNIVAVSSDDNGRTIINTNRLARRLGGIAHICQISPDASFAISSYFGKHLSVFDKGIRIYRPNFSEDDERERHPLLLRRILQTMPKESLSELEKNIRRDCLRASIERDGLPTKIPSFADIRLAASKARLQISLNRKTIDRELISAETDARKAAESQAEMAIAMAIQEEESRREAEIQRDSYRSQVFSLTNRIKALEKRLSEGGQDTETGDRPQKYEDLADWVEENLSGKVILHGRAKRALKDACYEDISLVCDAISLLANEYRQLLLGEIKKDEFDNFIASKGLDISGSITESRAREFGKEYYVNWNSKEYFLHGHLQKGNSREERYCLRVYFSWIPEDGIILVGWLPSHLKNSIT